MVKMANLVMSILPSFKKLVILKRWRSIDHSWEHPAWLAPRRKRRAQVSWVVKPPCPALHPPPPASSPIPELFIIKELPDTECELGAQLDFVLSYFPP
jgi:hypothetical protein